MKYLKYFTNESDYQTFKESEDYILPNVSYVEDSNEVMFNPLVKSVRIFDNTSYDDRKALYDLCFITAKSENCTTPIYVRWSDGELTKFDYYYINNDDPQYGDWASLVGQQDNGNWSYYRMEPENDYQLAWDD